MPDAETRRSVLLWDLWKVRILCLLLGMLLGVGTVYIFLLPGPVPNLDHEKKNGSLPGSTAPGPRKPSPASTPRGAGEATRESRESPAETQARQALDLLIEEHARKLRERLPVPRRGQIATHAGKTFHAALKEVSHSMRATGLKTQPYTAQAVYSILWYCDGQFVEPQEICAAYLYRDKAWALDRAIRKNRSETAFDSTDQAWIRTLFQ